MTDAAPKKKPAPRRKTAAKAPRARAPKRTAAPKSPAAHPTSLPSAAKPKPIHRTYTFAVGRRKSAVARVRYLPKGSGRITINGRELSSYFPTFELQKIVRDPLELANIGSDIDITVKVNGGGTRGQAEAVRLGISRVLVKLQPDLRTTLKRAGFLRRDPRVKERKKYGLKRARRAPQWQKR